MYKELISIKFLEHLSLKRRNKNCISCLEVRIVIVSLNVYWIEWLYIYNEYNYYSCIYFSPSQLKYSDFFKISSCVISYWKTGTSYSISEADNDMLLTIHQPREIIETTRLPNKSKLRTTSQVHFLPYPHS